MYPDLPYLILFFILGTSVGSFINVLIDRVPHRESILGRSHCDYCKTLLKWNDLIPLVSFVILKGRCRFCKRRISWQYPIVELITGILFVLFFLKFETKVLPFWLPIVSGLITIFFTDLKYQVIPDVIVYPLILLAELYRFLLPNFVYALFASYIVMAFFVLLIVLTAGRGMGGGDVKLGFLVGLLAGWPNVLVSVFLAFILGGIVAIILLLARKKRFGQVIAFGPFLVLGVLLSIFFGDKLLSWYLSRFLI